MSNACPQSTLSPYLTVKDVKIAADFYQKAFNFELLELKADNDGTPVHAEMKFKDQLILFGKEGAFGGTLKSPKSSLTESPITLCITCDDVDDFYGSATGQGAKSLSEPEDMFWGARMCRLQDKDNYTWCFLTHK